MRTRILALSAVVTIVLVLFTGIANACVPVVSGTVPCNGVPTWTIKAINEKNPDNTQAILKLRSDSRHAFATGTQVKVGHSVSVTETNPLVGNPGDKFTDVFRFTRINGNKITEIKQPFIASVALGEKCPITTPPTTTPKPVPPVVVKVPKLSLAAVLPNCDSTEIQATITIGNVNQPTPVEFIATSDAKVIQDIKPVLQPNKPYIVDVPNKTYGVVTLTLLYGGKSDTMNLMVAKQACLPFTGGNTKKAAIIGFGLLWVLIYFVKADRRRPALDQALDN